MDENSDPGTILGERLFATDEDALALAGRNVSFSVIGGSGETAFDVTAVGSDEPMQALISVQSSMLDHETNPTLSLDLELTDNGICTVCDGTDGPSGTLTTTGTVTVRGQR